MSVDLGGIDRLAVAIGLIDGDGDLVADWFSRPGHHLSRMLADDEQRAALLEFVDDVLGGTTATTDAAGRRWVPVADVEAGTFTVAAVIEALDDRVHVGAGVRLSHTAASGVGVELEAFVPLFATGRGDPPAVVEPMLLGTPGADLELDLALDLPDGEVAGGVGLDRAALGASIPTAPGAEPAFRLALEGLALPGATAPRDIVVDAAGLDELDDAVLDLLLGLVRAAAADPGVSGPFAGFAAMLGLGEDDVPDFPIADLRQRGAVALSDWLAAALAGGAARADWLGGLATLLGGTVDDDSVVLTVLGADVVLGVAVAPGSAALPTITPSVELSTPGAAGIDLALRLEPVRIDLGTGAAVALPSLSATLRVAAPAGRLLTGGSAGGLTIAVGSLEAGLALDAARRPRLVLTAFDADVGATHFDALDLSSPEALAAAAEDVVGDAAALLLEQLGPAGDAVAVLIGLAEPPGSGPAPDPLDVGAFLADPLGAVAAYWRAAARRTRRRRPRGARRAARRDRRAAGRGRDGRGGGHGARPVARAARRGRRPAGLARGGIVTVALEAHVDADDLAGSGVVATLRARAVLAVLDLGARSAAFLPAVDGRLELSGPGGAPLSLGTSAVGASAQALGLALAWRAGAGSPAPRSPSTRASTCRAPCSRYRRSRAAPTGA